MEERRAAAEAKCHSDRLESAAYMRRVANRRTAAHDCDAAQKMKCANFVGKDCYVLSKGGGL